MTNYKQTLLKLTKNLNTLREREAKYGANNAPLDLLNQISDHQKAISLTRQAITNEITEAEWHEALRPLLVNIRERSEKEPDTCGVSIGNVEGGISGSIIAGGDVSDVQVAQGSNIAQATDGGHAEVNISNVDQRGQLVSGDQYNAGGDITINQAVEEPRFWNRLSRVQLILAIVLGLVTTTAAVLAVPDVSDIVYGWFIPLCDSPATDGQILIEADHFLVAHVIINPGAISGHFDRAVSRSCRHCVTHGLSVGTLVIGVGTGVDGGKAAWNIDRHPRRVAVIIRIAIHRGGGYLGGVVERAGS